jgi:hypothetical protein
MSALVIFSLRQSLRPLVVGACGFEVKGCGDNLITGIEFQMILIVFYLI